MTQFALNAARIARFLSSLAATGQFTVRNVIEHELNHEETDINLSFRKN